MIKNWIKIGLLASSIAWSAIAHALVITVGGNDETGLPVPNGYTSSIVGACTIDFDDPAGTSTNACDVTFSGLVATSIVVGSVADQHAAPAGDNTYYLTVSPAPIAASPITLTLLNEADYFGIYIGSLDDYNSISFYRDGDPFLTITGSQLASYVPIDPNGNQAVATYFNIFTGSPFDSVALISTQAALEVDNIAIATVPAPATLALLGIGMIGLGLRFRARKS